MSKWFITYRQNWIHSRLLRFGYINRRHICDYFDVSMRQASNDLSLYQEQHPRATTYNKKLKQYEANWRLPRK